MYTSAPAPEPGALTRGHLNQAFVRLAWPLTTVLVAGLTLHNLLVLALIDANIPLGAVKLLSGWKDLIIASLLVGGVVIHRARLKQLHILDRLMVAFVLLNLVYVAISPDSPIQRLYGFRLNCILAAAYAVGRLLPLDRDAAQRALIALLAAVTAAAVIGMLEVFFIPTRAWLDWGLPRYTHSLGFYYKAAPFGLPENLFINLGGVLVRRAISVYLSPLALAFVVVLVLPAALWGVSRRRGRQALGWGLLVVLLVCGLAVTLTRAAVLMAVPVVLATAFVATRRQAVMAFAGGLAVALLLFMFTPISGLVTPRVDASLNPVARGGGAVGTQLVAGHDDSLHEHLAALLNGLKVIRARPLGLGVGQAGSIAARFGAEGRPGESTYLQLGSELGWLGLALVIAIHAMAVVQLLQRGADLRRDPRLAGLWFMALFGGTAIFILQFGSDILGDFPVVVPLWIAIGWLLTVSRAPSVAADR
jgi:hypothetical protein